MPVRAINYFYVLITMRLSSGWRLTVNPFAEPHAEAARFLLAGRPEMAVYVLKEAIASSPDDTNLRHHLANIQTAPPRGEVVKISGIIVAMHAAVAWLIFLGVLAALLMAGFACLFPLFFIFPNHIQAIVLAVELAGIVPAIFATIWIFCALWFAYLKLLPEEYALATDDILPSVLNTQQLGKWYPLARKRFFATRYGQPIR